MTQVNCPACYKPVETDRLVGNFAYCTCGLSWDLSGKKTKDKTESSGGVRTLIAFSILLVSCTLHFLSWDVYSFKILPLQIKKYSGQAKDEDYQKIANICQQRQKLDCQIQSLLKVHELNQANLVSLAVAGELLFNKKDFKMAAQVFKNYFSLDSAARNAKSKNEMTGWIVSSDVKLREMYASALMRIGDYQTARVEYRRILDSDDKKPNFTAARAYVEILIQQQDFLHAKEVIQEYRKAEASSGMFLEKEWKLIQSRTDTKVALGGGGSTKAKTRIAQQDRMPASTKNR